MPMKPSKPSAAALFAFTNALVPVRRAWVQAANHVLSEFGLPSSLAMTVIIVARTGNVGIRQNALAEEVGVNRGGMVRLVDQAVDAGLVERRDDLEDRRAKIVRALPKESPNKPSVMRESPQHLIRAAHEPDELFRL